jgi:hypothetical protein
MDEMDKKAETCSEGAQRQEAGKRREWVTPEFSEIALSSAAVGGGGTTDESE